MRGAQCCRPALRARRAGRDAARADAPTKELILALNAARPTGDRFVLDDLDDTHVLVDPAAVDAIAARVAALADELSFAPPPRAPHE